MPPKPSVYWPVVVVDGWDVIVATDIWDLRGRFEPRDFDDEKLEFFDSTGQRLRPYPTIDGHDVAPEGGALEVGRLIIVLANFVKAAGADRPPSTLRALIEAVGRMQR